VHYVTFLVGGLISKSELFYHLFSTCEFGCVDEFICLAKDTPLALIKALDQYFSGGMLQDLIHPKYGQAVTPENQIGTNNHKSSISASAKTKASFKFILS